MAAVDIDALAARMLQVQDAATQLPPLTGQHPGFDLAAAYHVAHRMHLRRLAGGDRPVGRKIGFTNANIWPQYDVHHPIWGHVYERTLIRMVDGHTSFGLSHLAEPRIEPEIVFGLRAAPPAGGDAAAMLACIAWVALAFEIVQSNFPEWKFQAADTVADGGLHGALLLGEPVPIEHLPDAAAQLASFTLELACDGRPVETGRGANVLGSPLKALAHLADVLAKQPELPPLRAGEVVTTGTVTGAYPVVAGQRWSAALHGVVLGGVSVDFAA